MKKSLYRYYFSVSVFSVFIILFSLPVSAEKSLVRFDNLTQDQIAFFHENGFDVPKTGRDYVEVVVDYSDESLNGSKLPGKSSVIIPDLDEYVSNILSSQTRERAYFSFETMTARLQEWSEQYSEIASLSSIGKSCEGRDIWALKISDNPKVDEKEPSALIVGGTHAREWISVEVPMESIKRLLESYGKDEKLTSLVNDREIWFVPMLNPDGLVFSQTKSKYWRKNRRKIDSSSAYGVDLNRNYGYKWGESGASTSPSADTYMGTAPFSEPETCAIKALTAREHFQASISFHSYSELILYPYSYAKNISCPDNTTFVKLSGEMAKFNSYTPQNSADLYPAAGESDDFIYSEHKTLAFTFELATTFIPAVTQIENICNQNVPAVFHLIEKAGTYALTTPSGDIDICRNLDSKTAFQALCDGKELSESLPFELKYLCQERMSVIEDRLASLSADSSSDFSESLQAVISESAGFESLKKKISDSRKFASLHR
ncbi:MAG: zinc carboxypeptidase [Candidatus Riflebacteria bacterium]|nr:zinc carboxypeptidase [Candidatus Riflebacteria bacterium]